MFGLLALRGVRHDEDVSTEPWQTPPAGAWLDVGTGGVGEEAVASVSPAQTPPSSGRDVARPMPDGPTPGQKRPPCTEPGEIEIKGGCWWAVVGAEHPPCGKNKYEYKGFCYAPVPNSTERMPTSDDP